MVGGGGTNPGGRGGFSLPSGHGPLPSSGAEGAAAETNRSKYLKEIQCLEESLDFYRDRITQYHEEE